MYKVVNGVRIKLTETEIQEQKKEGEKFLSSMYGQFRVEEYGPIGEQLDMIYHQGLDAWKAHIDAVKAKYPKPTDKES